MIKKVIQGMLAQADLQINRIQHAPYEYLLSTPRFNETTVELLGRPFRIADSRSFFFSYREIFLEEIYKFKCDTDFPRIIDCGSNYGTSIVYAKHIYPKARITGIEADPKIFKLLKANCAHLDVELLSKAVSDTLEPLTFYLEGSDGGRAAHPIEGKDTLTIEAVTLDDLIDGPVDFLKIDIEGSEWPALKACTKLDGVRNLFVEYHCFRDRPQILGDLLNKLALSGFRYYIRHQFCSAAPFTKEEAQLDMDLQLNIFAKR